MISRFASIALCSLLLSALVPCRVLATTMSLNGPGSTTTVEYGGPPYCAYHADFSLEGLIVTIESNAPPRGSAVVEMNELPGCPFGSLGRRVLQYRVSSAEWNSSGCVINFVALSKIEPATRAYFVGSPVRGGSAYEGAFTIVRTDSAPTLNFTAQLPVTLTLR
jgi:hypothetical protein